MCVGLGARLGSSGSDSESARDISSNIRGCFHSKNEVDILLKRQINPFGITCQCSRYISLLVITIRRQRQQVRRKFGHVSCLVEKTCQLCRWGFMRPCKWNAFLHFQPTRGLGSLSPSLQERDASLHTCLMEACCTCTLLNLQP